MPSPVSHAAPPRSLTPLTRAKRRGMRVLSDLSDAVARATRARDDFEEPTAAADSAQAGQPPPLDASPTQTPADSSDSSSLCGLRRVCSPLTQSPTGESLSPPVHAERADPDALPLPPPAGKMRADEPRLSDVSDDAAPMPAPSPHHGAAVATPAPLPSPPRSPTPPLSPTDRVLPVVVVGAGLAGLSAAAFLHGAGHRATLIEASAQLGGQLRTLALPPHAAAFDLAASFVPPTARAFHKLLRDLRVAVRPATDPARVIVQHAPSDPPRAFVVRWLWRSGFRVVGGMRTVVDALAAKLPADAVLVRKRVQTVAFANGLWHVALWDPERRVASSLRASAVIIAMPPRVVATSLKLRDAMLPKNAHRALDELARSEGMHVRRSRYAFVAVYDPDFAQDEEPPPRLWCRDGPLVEVRFERDLVSRATALVGRLKDGLLRAEDATRKDELKRLRRACLTQLEQVYGDRAATPVSVTLFEWNSATVFGVEASTEDVRLACKFAKHVREARGWGLWFTSAEMAEREPATVEGAVLEATRVVSEYCEWRETCPDGDSG